MLDVAVIIPFFQNNPKLLGLTIASILAQRIEDTRFILVVVDDGSPVPAQMVLNDVPIGEPHRLVLVRQDNGGPGAARNLGIEEALKLAPDYVSFIDSDDVWAPDHITRAINALQAQEADFYFSDILNDGEPGFGYFRFMRATLGREREGPPVIRTLDGRTAVDAIALECMPHMTTIVCRPALLEHVRFNERFRRACEDQLFFVDLARVSSRVTFSSALAGERGEGVSIYREAMAWDSQGAPFLLLDELAYRQHSLFAFDLKWRTRLVLLKSGQRRLNHFVFLFMRNLKRNPDLSLSSMFSLIKRAPVFLPSLLVAFAWLPMHYRRLKLESGARI